MDTDTRTPSRCEMDDVLQQLDICDDDSCWLQDGAESCSWPRKACTTSSLYYALEEEDDSACDVFVYDPLLFTPSSSAPASPSRGSFLHLSDRDKPLPTLPHYNTTPSPPSTPRSSRSYMSTPPSSPRLSQAPCGTPQQSRSRPPSANMGNPRSMYTHSAFPSISSTLSLLEERETPVEKRCGVIVTETNQPAHANAHVAETSRNSSESTIAAHNNTARRTASADPLPASPNGAGSDAGPARKPRPTLNISLSTSTSTPQLRELAELAGVPASPIFTASYTASPVDDTVSPRTVRHQMSLASLSPQVSSPLASSSFLLPPVEVEPPSRWSMDSVSRPADVGAGAGEPSPSSSSPKPRKRGRFMSLISRARAGSVGKQLPTPKSPAAAAPHAEESEFGVIVSPNESHFSHIESHLSHGSSHSTSSVASHGRYAAYPPPPIAVSPSTASSTSSSSTLPTPAGSQYDVSFAAAADPFCPASPTFAPASYLPEQLRAGGEPDGRCSPPPAPTLPAPAPGVPTASFFLPAHASAFPFLSAALARTRLRRRRKTLVIFCLSPPAPPCDAGEREGRAQIEAQRRERDVRRRCESVLQWCESFGPVRRVERKPDGSLHVHWKDWEVADMVCRVSGQVYIKGVGRVSLAWRYVN